MKTNQLILAKNIQVGMKVKNIHFELWQVAKEVKIIGADVGKKVVIVHGSEGVFMYYADNPVEIIESNEG